MRNIDEIIVHCSASPPSSDIGVEEIRNYHVGVLGWDSEGYHYVIRRNGEVQAGRPVSQIGAHTKGHNADTIGVCLVGGVDEDREPENNFTASQFMALAELLRILKQEYAIEKISGHRDYAAKACPSFDIHEFVKERGV